MCTLKRCGFMPASELWLCARQGVWLCIHLGTRKIGSVEDCKGHWEGSKGGKSTKGRKCAWDGTSFALSRERGRRAFNLNCSFCRKMDHMAHFCPFAQASRDLCPFFNLRHIRKYLSNDNTKALVHVFISSGIDYCNSLLCGMPEYQLNFSFS